MQGICIEPIKVYLAVPPMMGWGLERLLQSSREVELVGSAPDVTQALALGEKLSCDVLLAAVESAEEFRAIDRLLARSRARLLLLSGSRDEALVDHAVMAGARGIVKTNDPPASLLKAIEKVHEGELWIDRGATSRIFMEMARQKAAIGLDPERNKIASLTSRERQTIAAVTLDASAPAKVIAQRLCISEHTLRNHLTSIYSKLELCSRLALYAYAVNHELATREQRGS